MNLDLISSAALAEQSHLEDVDVVIPESPSDIVRRYDLRRAIMRGKEEVKTLCLQPPRWQTVSGMKQKHASAMNMTGLKFDIVNASIMSDAAGNPVHAGMVDQLTKRDFEHLTKEIDDNTPGPDLQLEYECPVCSTESTQSLRWDFDHFFGASSL